MVLYLVSFAPCNQILVARFIYPSCIQRPHRGYRVGISQRFLVPGKLEWQGAIRWRNYDAVSIQYNTGAWQTDRRTDWTGGRTDEFPISISLVIITVLTRDKNCDFLPISRFVSEMIQDRVILTREHQEERVCHLLNGVISNDLEWPLEASTFFSVK